MDHNEHFKAICEPAFTRIEDGQKEHKDKLNELIGLLRGSNGTPGALQRLDQLEDWRTKQEHVIQGHHHTIYGLNREPGLVDDIREQQRRQERMAKLAWTAISAFVLQAAIWIWGRITGS